MRRSYPKRDKRKCKALPCYCLTCEHLHGTGSRRGPHDYFKHNYYFRRKKNKELERLYRNGQQTD